MFTYLIKRLLLMVVTLVGIMVITFIVTRLTPGDPASLQIRGSTGGGAAIGGYEDLVEQNRRNLGLDRPLLINLTGEDRRQAAILAINDTLRSTEFWRHQGERRLTRLSTIAFVPALDRLESILAQPASTPTGAKLAPRDEQIRRLSDMLPRLAAESTLRPEANDPASTLDFWKKWYAANRGRFQENAVRSGVDDYLAGKTDTGAAVQRAGGFAVPYLIKGLDSTDVHHAWLANSALQAQTGFSFASTETEFADREDEVRRRWGSWWRRERLSFVETSRLENALNVFVNTQFGLWMTQALTFDFGDSYSKKKPVIDLIKRALPISALISGLSIIISYLIAIPIGIFSAVRKYTVTDGILTVILFILYSLPSFWVASLLLLTTTGPPFLNLLPARGIGSEGISFDASGFSPWFFDRAWHLVLPILCLTYGSLAFISRQMRSAMLETLNADFIRTARAKGLSGWSVIMRHALRNSLIPILTISAGILPELIAGAIIVESIFTIPGMGTLTFEAILTRDYPVINGVLFFSAFLTLLGILLADISYAIADPRISYDKA